MMMLSSSMLYTTIVVYNIDEKEEIITDKYAPYDNTLRLKDTEYYAFRDEDGNTVPLENLVAGDVVSAAVSLDTKLVIGEVSKTKLTGKISSITDEKDIEVNGHLYETVGKNLSWLSDIKLGAEGTILLDAFGFVASFEATRPTDNIMGYVLTAGTSGSSIKPKLQLGLITTEAEKMVAYTLAEKVVIDGTSCKTHDAILKALGDTDGTEASTDVTKQGIIFSVNQDREITKIDTASVTGSKEIVETSLQTRYTDSEDELHYKYGNGRFGDLFYWDRSTALNVMFVGDTTKTEEVNDTENYRYFKSGLSNDDPYSVTVYSVGKDNPNVDILVVNSKPSNSVSGTIAIAGKQVYALNEDGNYDRKLYYYVASTTASSAIISDEFDTIASNDSKTDLAKVKPGDIIRVGKDYNGNLTAIKRYYDYTNKTIESNPNYTMSKFNSTVRIYGGVVTNKYGSAVRFTNDIANLSKDPVKDSDFRWIKLDMNSGTDKKIFKYEVEGSEVIISKATADDAVDYAHVPFAPSGIMLQTTLGQQIDAAYIINVEKPANTGIYKVTFEPGENASGTKAFIRADLNGTIIQQRKRLHKSTVQGRHCAYNTGNYLLHGRYKRRLSHT